MTEILAFMTHPPASSHTGIEAYIRDGSALVSRQATSSEMAQMHRSASLVAVSGLATITIWRSVTSPGSRIAQTHRCHPHQDRRWHRGCQIRLRTWRYG